MRISIWLSTTPKEIVFDDEDNAAQFIGTRLRPAGWMDAQIEGEAVVAEVKEKGTVAHVFNSPTGHVHMTVSLLQ